MSITTKTGDNGQTSLCSGQRISKSSLRVTAYGEIDELSSALGMACAILKYQALPSRTLEQCDFWISKLQSLQKELSLLAADLATLGQTARVTDLHIYELEQGIRNLQHQLPQQRHFILPGGTPASGAMHLARAICRRAERTAVALWENEPENVNKQVLVYLNRLSDYLFLAARTLNNQANQEDIPSH